MVTETKCSKCTLALEFLKEQLELLSEKSKAKDISVADLVALSAVMDKLINTLPSVSYAFTAFHPAKKR